MTEQLLKSDTIIKAANDRATLRAEFIKKSIWATWKNTPLTADASFRRYFRLTNGTESVLLMDSPPDTEDIESYTKIDEWLLSINLRSPQIIKIDDVAGFAVIEDFGHQTYTHLLDKGDKAEPLYQLAVDVLKQIHACSDKNTITLPRYDSGFYQEEAALFIDWYWPARMGESISSPLREEFMAIWDQLMSGLVSDNDCVVLRDYHVDNLMLINDAIGVNSCGLLDFQDALIGSKAYDLVSLLEDARRDVDQTMSNNLIENYLVDYSTADKEGFLYDYQVLGAHRHIKVIGIFVRLCVRDKKHHYLDYLPRVQMLLENHLKSPVLQPLALWLKQHHKGDISAPLDFEISTLRQKLCA